MKKWLVGTVITIVVLGSAGYAGYNYFMNMAADKLSQELSKQIAEDPQLKQELDKVIGSEKTNVEDPSNQDIAKLASNGSQQNNTKPSDEKQTSPSHDKKASASDEPAKTAAGNAPSNGTEQKNADTGMQFDSKQDAVKFAMSRFSVSEINQVRQLASGGLTPEKKAELKKIAYSKFTPEEINAVRKAVGR